MTCGSLALVHLQKALEVFVALHGYQHLDAAASYMLFGNVYQSLGKYEEALEMHTKSLDIKARILGGDSHHVAHSNGSIGNFLDSMGKHEEALVQLQKALEVFVAVYGGNSHLDVAKSLMILVRRTGTIRRFVQGPEYEDDRTRNVCDYARAEYEGSEAGIDAVIHPRIQLSKGQRQFFKPPDLIACSISRRNRAAAWY